MELAMADNSAMATFSSPLYLFTLQLDRHTLILQELDKSQILTSKSTAIIHLTHHISFQSSLLRSVDSGRPGESSPQPSHM